MKILILQDYFPPLLTGGAATSTYELAIGMKDIGHEVFVVTTVRKGSEAGVFNYHGLKVFKIESNYHGRWRAYLGLYHRPVIKQLDNLLNKIKPDIVHANNINYHLSYHSLKVAKRHAKAVVFTARDTMSIVYGKLGTKRYLDNFDSRTTWLDHIKQAKKRWNPFRNLFIRRYLGDADRIITISKSLQEALLSNHIKGVEVIYNGIDTSGWDVDPNIVKEFKTKHSLIGKKSLLYGGRLSGQKGGASVIKALVIIAKEIPDAVVIVAGVIDEYAEGLKEEAIKLGIGDKLIFTGWLDRDEIKHAVASSDVVLMPSCYLDAFGRVNIEAMAAKKPVIGTCYGGTPEIVIDGETGYIVNPLHPEKIAEKAIDLLNNKEKAKKFGQAGFDRVKTNFNLEDKVNDHIVLYKSLIGM